MEKVELKKFKHRIKGRVQFADVDSYRVVHNLRYLYWIEQARTDYFRDLGLPLSKRPDFTIMTVHADIDYFAPAIIDDEYEVISRISKLGESSLEFENIVIRNEVILVRASCVLVQVSPKDGKSLPIPDDIRSKIIDFEAGDLIIKAIIDSKD